MSIIKRQKKSNPFVQMDRSIFNNKDLSFKAKGLYAHLMALPDDWVIYEKDLANRSTDTLYSVKQAIRELIDAGFISRRQVNSEGGKLVWETIFYEYSVDNPHFPPKCDIPTSETPTSAIRTYTNESLEVINKLTVVDTEKFDKCLQGMQGAGIHFMKNSTNILKFTTIYRKIGGELAEHLTNIVIKSKPSQFSYIEGILSNWEEKGIDTVEKAVAESEARKKPSKPSKDDDLEKLRQMYGG